jgi:hypothetical protein
MTDDTPLPCVKIEDPTVQTCLLSAALRTLVTGPFERRLDLIEFETRVRALEDSNKGGEGVKPVTNPPGPTWFAQRKSPPRA